MDESHKFRIFWGKYIVYNTLGWFFLNFWNLKVYRDNLSTPFALAKVASWVKSTFIIKTWI